MRLTQKAARQLWLHAQGLDREQPFGTDETSTLKAVEQLGYVQIDTISVIERSHHHILFTRIPHYRKADLHRAQSIDKSIFEYWTHALAYVPTNDFRYFLPEMKRLRRAPGPRWSDVGESELKRVLARVRREGALSIRDIDDDVLVDKTHPWGSRKPSKRALQWGFYGGSLAISERLGMVKKYELTDRHFAWNAKPRAASAREVTDYLIDRALRSQAVVSLDSICHLLARRKPEVRARLEARVRQGLLDPVTIGNSNGEYWMEPGLTAAASPASTSEMVRLLSPFDPLVIQRRRLEDLFGYAHRFEAYLPPAKRVFGYFALPVLIGDDIVAVLDLKTDRAAGRLRVQRWTWRAKQRSGERRRQIEEELHRFARFQLELPDAGVV